MPVSFFSTAQTGRIRLDKYIVSDVSCIKWTGNYACDFASCFSSCQFLQAIKLRAVRFQSTAKIIKVVIALGFHLFPFRTEKLSPIAPMVLHTSGRVGSRRSLQKPPGEIRGAFLLGDGTIVYVRVFTMHRISGDKGCLWVSIELYLTLIWFESIRTILEPY